MIVSLISPWQSGPIDKCRECDDHGAGNHKLFPTKPEGPLFGDHASDSPMPQPGPQVDGVVTAHESPEGIRMRET
jgi:hypothetical protein